MEVSELLHFPVNLLALYKVGRAALIAVITDGVVAPAREEVGSATVIAVIFSRSGQSKSRSGQSTCEWYG